MKHGPALSRSTIWRPAGLRVLLVVTGTVALLTAGCVENQPPPATEESPNDSQVSSASIDEQLEAIRAGRSDQLKLSDHLTDKDLAALDDLPAESLRELQVERAQLSDAAMQHIARFNHLQVLVLRGQAQLTDQGLRQLSPLEDLRRLVLDGTSITDEGLPALTAFPKLEILRLESPEITDRGLAVLKEFTSLRTLILVNASITDAGIPHFKQMDHLQSLYLFGDQLSDQGADELKSAMPHVNW